MRSMRLNQYMIRYCRCANMACTYHLWLAANFLPLSISFLAVFILLESELESVSESESSTLPSFAHCPLLIVPNLLPLPPPPNPHAGWKHYRSSIHHPPPQWSPSHGPSGDTAPPAPSPNSQWLMSLASVVVHDAVTNHKPRYAFNILAFIVSDAPKILFSYMLFDGDTEDRPVESRPALSLPGWTGWFARVRCASVCIGDHHQLCAVFGLLPSLHPRLRPTGTRVQVPLES